MTDTFECAWPGCTQPADWYRGKHRPWCQTHSEHIAATTAHITCHHPGCTTPTLDTWCPQHRRQAADTYTRRSLTQHGYTGPLLDRAQHLHPEPEDLQDDPYYTYYGTAALTQTAIHLLADGTITPDQATRILDIAETNSWIDDTIPPEETHHYQQTGQLDIGAILDKETP